MKMTLMTLLTLCISTFALASISETVFVESPTDTDSDGRPDLIYVKVDRPVTDRKLSTIFRISPYALGGTEVPMHNVDMDLLPQDERLASFLSPEVFFKTSHSSGVLQLQSTARYAQIRAHSVGTGHSTGCPTVGDIAETLAAKSVIDWLNGRARAFSQDGKVVKADWANGKVGMTGTSYDGTLPIMVATTGVDGLKAIIPVAAISNWYNYYRANGLVVNPGGYVGEDADILGHYIVRKGACRGELQELARSMGREHGDFSPFWQKRNYIPLVKNIKAATFIIHGQNDWNVKQKHAIELWEALQGVAPSRLFLHRGGHSSTSNHNVPKKVQDWFDHFLEDVDNGITRGPQVEVELPDGSLVTQNEWPHEKTRLQRLYFSKEDALTAVPGKEEARTITDSGNTLKMEALIDRPTARNQGRLLFLSSPLERAQLLSGTSRVSLNLSVLNRRAANITVAIVEYDKTGKGKIITRGWADPQNSRSIKQGEKLIPGKNYQLIFNLEPKQYRIGEGKRLGIMITSTDYDFTLRPGSGTEIKFNLGPASFIDLWLSED